MSSVVPLQYRQVATTITDGVLSHSLHSSSFLLPLSDSFSRSSFLPLRSSSSVFLSVPTLSLFILRCIATVTTPILTVPCVTAMTAATTSPALNVRKLSPSKSRLHPHSPPRCPPRLHLLPPPPPSPPLPLPLPAIFCGPPEQPHSLRSSSSPVVVTASTTTSTIECTQRSPQ